MTWHTMDEKPAIGRRVLVLWVDGIGAEMFFVRPDGWISEEGDLYEAGEISPANIQYWAYLPDDVLFWCETEENPVRLEAHLQ
ncbi:hypothetical protein LMIY3S_03659 [Labrys miyagiensis]